MKEIQMNNGYPYPPLQALADYGNTCSNMPFGSPRDQMRIAELKHKDVIVKSVLSGGGTLLDCVEMLSRHNAEIKQQLENLTKSGTAPVKILVTTEELERLMTTEQE